MLAPQQKAPKGRPPEVQRAIAEMDDGDWEQVAKEANLHAKVMKGKA